MLAMFRLFAGMAGQSLIGATKRVSQRLARATALFVVAMLFILIGLTSFAVAAFLLLARVVDPILAALLVGAVCSLLGAVLIVVAREQVTSKRLFATTSEVPKHTPDVTVNLQAKPSPIDPILPLGLAVLVGFLAATRKK